MKVGKTCEDGTGREPYRDFLPLTLFEDRPNGSLAAITRDHNQHRQSVARRYVFDLFMRLFRSSTASQLGKNQGEYRTVTQRTLKNTAL